MNTSRSGLPWTQKDKEYLKGAYHVFPIKQIAEDLQRTPDAVRRQAVKINATVIPNFWSKEEVEYLEREYPFGTDINEMVKVLKRDKRLINTKANSLGLYRPDCWLECEDEFLLAERKKKTAYKNIAKKLDKTVNACYSRFHLLKTKGVVKK